MHEYPFREDSTDLLVRRTVSPQSLAIKKKSNILETLKDCIITRTY